MTGKPRLVDADAAGFDALPCCGIKSNAHPGRGQKRCWLEQNAECGLRARNLLAPDGRPAGYIEYVPGEYAWRGVDAPGCLFIHCVWIHAREFHKKGWGSFMIQACLDDAKASGRRGVAAMVRESPWMADHRLFLANGFEAVDTAPPDYRLLVRKLEPDAPNPSFRKGWDERLARYSKGMTIVRSSQCPYTAKFTEEIIDTAEREFHMKPKVVELKTYKDAQAAPTPYATFSLIYQGRVLADHQISRTRFRNIMSKLK